MASPQKAYHSTRRGRKSLEYPDDNPSLRLLEAARDVEMSDARITPADQRFVLRLLAVAERILSDEALMHLAGGAENAAWRKRKAERARPA